MLITIAVVLLILLLFALKDKVADWGVSQVQSDAATGRSVRNFLVLVVGAIVLFVLYKAKHHDPPSDDKIQSVSVPQTPVPSRSGADSGSAIIKSTIPIKGSIPQAVTKIDLPDQSTASAVKREARKVWVYDPDAIRYLFFSNPLDPPKPDETALEVDPDLMPHDEPSVAVANTLAQAQAAEEKHEVEAASALYLKAAEMGNAEGIRKTCLANGARMLTQDAKEAELFKWCTKASEFGNAMAMNYVGMIYESGYGVPRNTRQAITWYRRAALSKTSGRRLGQEGLARLGAQ